MQRIIGFMPLLRADSPAGPDGPQKAPPGRARQGLEEEWVLVQLGVAAAGYQQRVGSTLAGRHHILLRVVGVVVALLGHGRLQVEVVVEVGQVRDGGQGWVNSFSSVRQQ